jgi:hypothetical protein
MNVLAIETRLVDSLLVTGELDAVEVSLELTGSAQPAPRNGLRLLVHSSASSSRATNKMRYIIQWRRKAYRIEDKAKVKVLSTMQMQMRKRNNVHQKAFNDDGSMHKISKKTNIINKQVLGFVITRDKKRNCSPSATATSWSLVWTVVGRWAARYWKMSAERP